MNNRIQHKSLSTLAVVSLMAALTGCQTLATNPFAKKSLAGIDAPKEPAKSESTLGLPKVAMPKVSTLWSDDEKAPIVAPERMVSTWSEAVLHQDGKGTRGFGGRLYFHERSSAKPVRVEGQLVVYAFVEDDRKSTDHKPTKRYVFPPEQFAKHESESEIGTSYSIWLPWDAAGGQQTEVSLIARFEPSQGGGLVVSDQTRHRLPGTPRPDTMLANKPDSSGAGQGASFKNNVMQTSGQSPASHAAISAVYEQETGSTPQQLKATTISLPSSFQGFGNRGISSPRGAQTQPSPKVTTLPTAVPTSPPAIETAQATPIGTTVKYLSPGESVRRGFR